MTRFDDTIWPRSNFLQGVTWQFFWRTNSFKISNCSRDQRFRRTSSFYFSLTDALNMDEGVENSSPDKCTNGLYWSSKIWHRPTAACPSSQWWYSSRNLISSAVSLAVHCRLCCVPCPKFDLLFTSIFTVFYSYVIKPNITPPSGQTGRRKRSVINLSVLSSVRLFVPFVRPSVRLLSNLWTR